MEAFLEQFLEKFLEDLSELLPKEILEQLLIVKSELFSQGSSIPAPLH